MLKNVTFFAKWLLLVMVPVFTDGQNNQDFDARLKSSVEFRDPLLEKVFPGVVFYLQTSDMTMPVSRRIAAQFQESMYVMPGQFNQMLKATGNTGPASPKERIKAFLRLYHCFDGSLDKLDMEFNIRKINRTVDHNKFNYAATLPSESMAGEILVQYDHGQILRIEVYENGTKKDVYTPLSEASSGVKAATFEILNISPQNLNGRDHYYCVVGENGAATSNTVQFRISNLPPNSSVYLEVVPIYGYGGTYFLDQIVATNGSGVANYTWTPANSIQTGICEVKVTYHLLFTVTETWANTWLIPEKTLTGTFNNGYDYVIYFNNQFFDSHTLGKAHADAFAADARTALTESWVKQVNDWQMCDVCTGDKPEDADSKYELMIDDNNGAHNLHVNSTTAGNFARGDADRFIGIRYNSWMTEDLYSTELMRLKVAIAHEFYHGIQWSINEEWGNDWMCEGQARFIPSVQYPEEEYLENTQHLFPVDANDFITSRTNAPIDLLDYNYCIFWRFLFESYYPGATAARLQIIRECCQGNTNAGNAAAKTFMDSKLNGSYSTFGDALKVFSKWVYFNDPGYTTWNPCPNAAFYARPPIQADPDNDGVSYVFDGTNSSDITGNIVNPFGMDYAVFGFTNVDKALFQFDGDPDSDGDFADFTVKVVVQDNSAIESETFLSLTAGKGSYEVNVNNRAGIRAVVIITRLDVDAKSMDNALALENDYKLNFCNLPVTITVSPLVICAGEAAQLTASGANTYSWSNGLGSGSTVTVYPLVTTTYTVTATSLEGCSAVFSATVTVNPPPQIAVAANPPSVAPGGSSVLTATGALTYEWGQGLGSGDSKTVSPAVTTTYSVTGTDANGCTGSATVTVIVTGGTSALSGTVTYGNTAETRMSNCTVTLMEQGTPVQSSLTDLNGNYSFSGVAAGTYSLATTTSKPFLGINMTDAILILKYWARLWNLTGIKWLAGFVNLDNVINSRDALYVMRRFTGLATSFPRGDWVFENPQVIMDGTNSQTVNFKALCVGDVNGSGAPTDQPGPPPGPAGKEEPADGPLTQALVAVQVASVCPETDFDLLIMAENLSSVNAMNLIINYDSAVATWLGSYTLNAAFQGGIAEVNSTGNQLRLGWMSLSPATVANGVLCTFSYHHKNGSTAFSFDTVTPGETCFAGLTDNLIPVTCADGSLADTPPPYILSQPVNETVPANGSVTFTVATNNADQFQWQCSTNGGAAWSDLQADANYFSVNSPTMIILEIPDEFDGNLYRCRITGGCGYSPVYSDWAMLTVVPAALQACCFPDGTCQDVAVGTCLQLGGVPRGAGTTCQYSSCPVQPSDFSLIIGSYVNPGPGLDWIGGAGRTTRIRLSVSDPSKLITRVNFYYSTDFINSVLFYSDFSGDVFRYGESPDSLVPGGDPDGWCGYLVHDDLPQVFSPVMIYATAIFSTGDSVMVPYMNYMHYDPVPPSDFMVSIQDWQSTASGQQSITFSTAAGNLDHVAYDPIPVGLYFAKNIPLVDQHDPNRGDNGDYHCAPAAVAACLEYFTNSNPGNPVTGGLNGHDLTDQLAGEMNTETGHPDESDNGTSAADAAAGAANWIKNNGDGYNVQSSGYDIYAIGDQLAACHDVIANFHLTDGTDQWGHSMTMNSLNPHPDADGKYHVTFMDPDGGQIIEGTWDLATGQFDFPGEGFSGTMDQNEGLIFISDKPEKKNAACLSGKSATDSVTLLIDLPAPGFYLVKYEMYNLTGSRFDGYRLIERIAHDFGDAPEGTLAYTDPPVTGNYPTCRDYGPAGFISHEVRKACFGAKADWEDDGNAGNCSAAGSGGCNADESFDDLDAGLIVPGAFTITGGALVVPCPGASSVPLAYACSPAVWGQYIDIFVTDSTRGLDTAWVNVLADWNHDGAWGGESACWSSPPVLIPEHVLVNFPVPYGYSGPLSGLMPAGYSFITGPDTGYVWVRFSITDHRVPENWNGEGAFSDGETEDYLLKVGGEAPRHTITGKMVYENTVQTPLTGITVNLFQYGLIAGSAVTDPSGNYTITDMLSGEYSLDGQCDKPWGGVNSADALAVMKHFIGQTPLSGLKLEAADVDGNGMVNSGDALKIARRFVHMDNYFIVGDWVFDKPVLILGDPCSCVWNLKALCYGDVNGTYTSIPRLWPGVTMEEDPGPVLLPGSGFRVPVFVKKAMTAGAASLVLECPDPWRVKEVSANDNGLGTLVWKAGEGNLRIAWYSPSPLVLSPGGLFLTILAEAPGNVLQPCLLSAGSESVITGPDGTDLTDVVLTVPRLSRASGIMNDISCAIHPNPFISEAVIAYSLAEKCMVRITVFNAMGQEVIVLEDNTLLDAGGHRTLLHGERLPEGIYALRMEISGQSGRAAYSGLVLRQR